MSNDAKEQERWATEAEFFDRDAQKQLAALRPAHPMTVERYGKLKRRRFSKEYRFRILGDLKGKKVLDVGCGDGANALNFALLGAQVTGVDISPGAIELAKRRAEINGVADRCEFICSPMEKASLAPGSFDVVWGDAILHHLLADLDAMMAQIVSFAKPGGIVMFGEPTAVFGLMRGVRAAIPVHTDHTPDERPLQQQEFDIITTHLVDPHIRFFSVLSRFDRFVLKGYNYETASLPRRALFNVLIGLDYMLLSLPLVEKIGGTCVIYGKPARSA